MRWVFCLCSALAIAIFAAFPAQAQFYVGAHGGVSIQTDSDLDIVGVTGVDVEAEFDVGPLFGAVAGYRFGPFRVEGEVTYRDNDIDDITVNGVSLVGAGLPIEGDVSSVAIMANAYYDINTGSVVTPYIGGGIGAVVINGELGVPSLGIPVDDETDTVFGGQIAAGVAVEVMQNLALTLDYRFLITSDPDFDGIEAEFRNHSIRGGLRYTF